MYTIDMTHSALLEAVLFHKAEPVSFSELEKILQISREELLKTISSLKSTLEGRGITLVTKDTEVMLRTSKEASTLIEQITKDELSKDLGKAGLETLSVILYKGPISKKDIEYIRGVQSAFILRKLMIRGLIERLPDPKDSRSHIYRATFDLLSYLGISDIQELQEYDKASEEIDTFMNSTLDEN